MAHVTPLLHIDRGLHGAGEDDDPTAQDLFHLVAVLIGPVAGHVEKANDLLLVGWFHYRVETHVANCLSSNFNVSRGTGCQQANAVWRVYNIGKTPVPFPLGFL